MIRRSDWCLFRTKPAFLFVAILILFGSSRCAPAPTFEPVNTLRSSPSPQATPNPTGTFVQLPTETHIPTLTETTAVTKNPVTNLSNETLSIPLGIGIWDADNVAFFNKFAWEEDVISVRTQFVDLLEDVRVGKKMLILGPRDEERVSVSTVVSEANEQGVTILGYNLETALTEHELVSKEIQMHNVASEAEMLYAFGPTLGKLMKHYDDFSRNADIIVLQSQRFQTTEDYEKTVEDLIARIRSSNPGAHVWVQVSVNPPIKRDITPEEVIRDIQLIADHADLIWIFFSPERALVMEDVFMTLRNNGNLDR